ncbi:MAG: hypothetical protein P1U81_03290 [Verrucomicrobiales bacterium]|nr:hypothetical protein [Verrucomicrobiales bacterium]
MKHFAFTVGMGLVSLAFPGCTTVDDTLSTAAAPSPAAAPDEASSFRATAEADRKARQTEATITPYPFDTCAVQFHKPFKDGKPKHRRVYKGQEVLFCCTPCVKAFDMNPEPYMPRILAAANAQATGSSQ